MTDDLFERARALVLEHQKASISWLQRQMRIGYNSAARFIELMEAAGEVSAPDHVGRREVLRPPSASLPGASVETVSETNPWDRNEGKFDAPTSGLPPVQSTHRRRIEEGWIGPAPLPVIVEDEAAGDAFALDRLAADLVEKLGLEGARRVVRAAAERDGSVRHPRAAPPEVEWLIRIVDRIRALFEERRQLTADIRDCFAFAKDVGLNVKALRRTIADLEADKDKRFEVEANTAIYRTLLGVEEPDFVVEIPSAPPPAPAKAKKITAKEKQFRDALALTHAAHAIVDQ